MDDERSWDRVADVVRKVAEEQGTPVPPAFVSVSGTVFEREAQRRAALEEFARTVDDFPVWNTDTPVHQIADLLDEYWLETHLVNDKEPAE